MIKKCIFSQSDQFLFWNPFLSCRIYFHYALPVFRHCLSQVSEQINFSLLSKLVWGGGNGGCLDDGVDTWAAVENHKHDALIRNPCWQVRNQSSLAQREDKHFNASGFHPLQLTPHTAYCSPKAINHRKKCHIIHRYWNHNKENEKWLRKTREYHIFSYDQLETKPSAENALSLVRWMVLINMSKGVHLPE